MSTRVLLLWLAAARLPTLPASVVPVLVGTAAAGNGAHLRIGPFLAALVAALLIQTGTNFTNDVFDHRKRADTAERLGPRRLIQTGAASPGQVLGAAYLSFGIAALLGLYLITIGGVPILILGALSILAGYAYTGGPAPFAYNGLADLVCFLFFGPVAVLGSTYVQIDGLTGRAIVASLPVGLLVTNILIVNNLRDVDTDRRAGKRTLAVRLGRRVVRRQYALFALLAYLVPPALAAATRNPWLLLPLVTVPLTVRATKIVLRTNDGETFNAMLRASGRVHMLFGLLLSAGLWL
jgi:1,4-dihydroxy-2-naphthoate polyprenyltransferase